MTPIGSTVRIVAVAALFAGVSLWSALAAGFNGETGGELVTEVVIRGPDGKRLNSAERLDGLLGVESCKDYEGKRIVFRYHLDRTYRGEIRRDNVYLMEFPDDPGFEGTCRPDEDKDGCTRIEHANPAGVSISTGERVVEVAVDFDALRTIEERNEERCAYEQTVGGAGADAGADVGTDAETGTDAGGQATEPLEDHYYVVRVFLRGVPLRFGGEDRNEVVDGPILLDRSRPPPPSGVDAQASENVMNVAFTPPDDDQSDIGSYFVFYSNEPIDQGRSPEDLSEAEGVERRVLTNFDRSNEDQFVARVRGLDRDEGNSLYVGVASRENSGNFSRINAKSDPITVLSSADFWERYRSAGGSETGGYGCQADSAPPVSMFGILVAVVGLVGFRRRFR